MKLHFHGQDYEDPYLTWQITEGKVAGKYRGVTWKLHLMKNPHHIPSHNNELVYRGIHYVK